MPWLEIGPKDSRMAVIRIDMAGRGQDKKPTRCAFSLGMLATSRNWLVTSRFCAGVDGILAIARLLAE